MQDYNIIRLHYVNEVHLKIETSTSIEAELFDEFSFKIPNHFFNPKVKAGVWNGIIHLYNRKTKLIYKGLVKKIVKFAEARGYVVEDETGHKENAIAVVDFQDFIKEIHLPENKTPRDYQIAAAVTALRKKRMLFLSPTASGKSLIIYLILRFLNLKSLLIVPTLNLVQQMYDDFGDYSVNDSWNTTDKCHAFSGNKNKDNSKDIVITTWQTLQNVEEEWFEEQAFDVILVDEAHYAKNKQLINIMEKNKKSIYRYGTTGTLDNKEIHHFTLEGLFGEIKEVIETVELMKQKYISDLVIKCLILQYTAEDKKILNSMIYNEEKKVKVKSVYRSELAFILAHEKRNNFIASLALSLKGNTLILFQFKKLHGEIIRDLIDAKNKSGKETFYISGDTEVEIREATRKIVEKKGEDCIIIASSGVFSTGINIIKLDNIILAHPSKAEIRLLQSIGRGLRRDNEKVRCVLFDIADDLSKGKKKNYAYQHFIERLRIYMKKKFTYKIHKIDLGK